MRAAPGARRWFCAILQSTWRFWRRREAAYCAKDWRFVIARSVQCLMSRLTIWAPRALRRLPIWRRSSPWWWKVWRGKGTAFSLSTIQLRVAWHVPRGAGLTGSRWQVEHIGAGDWQSLLAPVTWQTCRYPDA